MTITDQQIEALINAFSQNALAVQNLVALMASGKLVVNTYPGPVTGVVTHQAIDVPSTKSVKVLDANPYRVAWAFQIASSGTVYIRTTQFQPGNPGVPPILAAEVGGLDRWQGEIWMAATSAAKSVDVTIIETVNVPSGLVAG